jgi:hypothetical protein
MRSVGSSRFFTPEEKKTYDIEKVASLIRTEEHEEPPIKPADRIKEALMPILISQAYRNGLLLLGVVSCFQYVIQTYLEDERKTDKIDYIINLFSLVELAIACVFTCTLALGYCFSDDRWEYTFE